MHEQLLNPVESLTNTLKLFKYYQEFFKHNLPKITDIGIIKLDSSGLKDKL